MKKLSSIITIICCTLLLVACNFNTDPSHIHDYTIVNYNENAHWLECECKDKAAVEFHKGGTATCMELAVCSVCSVEYGKLESHNYVDGICSKCNSVDANEIDINKAAWNSMLDISNFENFTVEFYGNFSTGEKFFVFNKVEKNAVLTEGTIYTNAELVANMKTSFFNIVLPLLGNFENYIFDNTNNVYNSTTQIVYNTTFDGRNVTITANDVVVRIDANNHLSSMSCEMKQEFGEQELNLVVTFEFYDYGTTQINDHVSKKSEYIGEYVLHHIDRELVSGGETTTYNLGEYYFGTVLSEQTIRAGINNGTVSDYISYDFGNEVLVNCNFVILDNNTAVAHLDSAVDLFNNGNATDVFYFDIVEIDGQPCFVLNATLGNHNYSYYVVKAPDCELEEQEYSVRLHNKNGEAVDLETLNYELPNEYWEPGHTEVFYFSITNNTDQDLRYTVMLDIQEVKQNLTEVIDYVLIPDAQFGDVTSLNAYNLIALNNGINDININDIVIPSVTAHYYAIAFRMQESAGNSYQNGDFASYLIVSFKNP